jgi:hypothetical protein
MKTLFTLFTTFLIGSTITGQFNNSYVLSGAMETYDMGSLIPMSYGSVAFTSTHILNAQDPPYMTMVVTHVAEDGSILYNTQLETTDPMTTFLSSSADLVQTNDGGLLVSCFISNYSDLIYQPALFKISSYGNLEWVKSFPINVTDGISDLLHKTSIIRVEEDIQIESYLLAFASNSTTSSRKHTTVLNVNILGEIVWGKEYTDSQVESNDLLISDYPIDIAYSPDQAWRRLRIGSRLRHRTPGFCTYLYSI